MLSTLCTQTDFKSKVYEDNTLDIFCDDIKTSSSEVDSLKTDDEESRLRKLEMHLAEKHDEKFSCDDCGFSGKTSYVLSTE